MSARAALARELGIEPGSGLQAMERKVLRHDPALLIPGGDRRPAEAVLPSGVVTFVLSDIVGSTSLWEQHPQGMADAVARHAGLIHQAMEASGGVVLKARGEGDSTFSVFARASDAVVAALAAQRALVGEGWPESTPILVRIAVHTGEAFERDGDYYGPTVNRAARIRSLASGGEVLLSQSTAEVVRDALPDDVALVDLGSHELSGLIRGEQISGLVAPGLPEIAALTTTLGVGPHTGLEVPLPARFANTPPLGFVGRRSALDQLSDALKDVSAGSSGRAVLVSGEPGIGKTALVSQLAVDAHDQGAVVLYGRCDEGLGIPYQPWVEALSHLVEHAPDAVLSAHAEALVALVPSLATRSTRVNAARSADPETERHLLFGAVVDLVDRVAALVPVVLVLDDLHWADRASLLLLRHVLASLASTRLLVLATFRLGDVGVEDPLSDLLATLRRDAEVERMSVQGLDELELLDLVYAVGGQGLADEGIGLRDALAAETEGNPFFVLEILRDLAETGALGSHGDGGSAATPAVSALALPASLREVIRQRVHRLGTGPTQMLASASAVGRDFDSKVLGPVAELTEVELLDALDGAVCAALITETPAASGRFSFVHSLAQRAIYDELSGPRRQRLHRRIAEVIESLPDAQDRLAELAHHWLAAGELADPQRVFVAAIAAGDAAQQRLAPDESVRWYSEALKLVDRLEPTRADRERCAVLLRLGRAQRLAGQPEFGQTLFDAARLAQQLGDTDQLVEAALANTRGMAAHLGRLDRERIGVLQAALDALGESSAGLRARLLAQWASETMFSPGYDNEQLITEALALSEAADDPEARSMAVSALLAKAIPHNLEQRRAHQRELLDLVSHLGPAKQFWAFGACVTTAVQAGDLVEAEGFLDGMRRSAQASGDPTSCWMAEAFAAAFCALRGEPAAAEEHANASLRLGQEAGQPDALQVHGTLLLETRRLQGRESELYDVVADLAAQYPEMAAGRAELAWLLAADNREEEARAVLDDLAPELSSLWIDRMWASTLAYVMEAAALTGHVASARAVVALVEPFADQWIFNGGCTDGPIALVLGEGRTVLGDFEQAASDFEHALTMARHAQSPYWTTRAQLELATMLVQRGEADDDHRAAGLVREALHAALGHGYAGIERRCLTVFGQVRDAPGVGPSAGPIEVPLPGRCVQASPFGFVGRGSELEVLAVALKDLNAGSSGRAVVIGGEPGIGKTALVSRMAVQAHDQGVVVLYGRCDEGLGIPYQPWVESLSHLVAHVPDTVLEAHVGARGGDLLALVPDLAMRSRRVPIARSADPETERHLLFGSVVDLLSRTGTQVPVVLILDDLHWADRASLLLLRHVLGSITSMRLLVLATFRPGDVGAADPLADVLASLHREVGVERMNLQGLDDLELLDLMHEAGGHDLDDEAIGLRDALAAETDGNPFFVLEILRHLAETGAITQADDGRWQGAPDLSERGLPVSVREVIGRRVHRLGTASTRVLSVASVIGRDFDLTLLGAVADTEEDALLDALDAARAAALIDETAAPGRLSFVHALIQRALYDDLGGPRRRQLHRRIAQALEALPASTDERVSELALHWYAAAESGELDKALRYSIAAGDQAQSRLAPDEAVRWYTQALELVGHRAPDTRDRTRCDVLLRLGTAERLAGRPEFRQTLLDAAHLAQRLGDSDRLVEAALTNTRGIMASVFELDRERIEMLRAALDALGASSPGRRARVISQLAIETMNFPDYGAEALIDEALALTEATAEPEARWHALHALSLYGIPHNLAERRDHQLEYHDLASRLDPARRFWTLNASTMTAWQSGNLLEARRHIDDQLQLAHAVGDPMMIFLAEVLKAADHLSRGDCQSAENQAYIASRVGHDSSQPDANVIVGANIFVIRQRQGREAELAEVFAGNAAETPGAPSWQAVRAFAFAAANRSEEARAILDGFVADLPHLWLDGMWSTALVGVVEAAAPLGHVATAHAVLPLLDPFSSQWAFSGSPDCGPIALFTGMARTMLGEYQQAEADLAQALTMAKQATTPYWIARAQLEWAHMLTERNRAEHHGRARTLLAEALNIADEFEFAGIRGRVITLQGSLASS
jgi:predicted ATPase/class 3 adenylate cyclase